MDGSVLQPWVTQQTLMKQSVLLASIRGPDGVANNHVSKLIIRWLRRCVLISAFNKIALSRPFDEGQKVKGSFTGASIEFSGSTNWQTTMDEIVIRYLDDLDEIPLHFHLHLMHATEILGYKHPDDEIRAWWFKCYLRIVNDLHLTPETEEDMDKRLGDNEKEWLEAQIFN